MAGVLARRGRATERRGMEPSSEESARAPGPRSRRVEVSAELWSILLVGAALAALTLTGMGEIRSDMRDIREDVRDIREDMRERFSLVEMRLSSIEARLALIKREQGEFRGIVEGLRDTAADSPKTAGS